MSTLHRHELAVLTALKEPKRLRIDALLSESELGRDEALWAVENLAEKSLITAKKEGRDEVKLTKEGEEYARGELPEQSLLKKMTTGAMELDKLKGEKDQIGLVWAKKRGLAVIEGKMLRLTDKGKDAAREGLPESRMLRELEEKKEAYGKYKNTEGMRELIKRNLVEVRSREEVKEVEITQKGVLELAKERQVGEEEIEVLDRSIIAKRSWVGKKFRAYNVEAEVEPGEVAMRHPLRRLIEEAKQAYTSLGFSEVSGPVIDSSFWVFDYLFMPQHHPAREMQDTFFLSKPSKMKIEDRGLVKRVKEVHEKAWHSEWSEDIAMRAVPRTHMTSVTGRHMQQIISDLQKDPNSHELPIKIFSIGRVFRNENIDFKHLADFYQMDGMIIGKHLTLANLFDVLLKLYAQLGISIKFKPSFFPYVEPGVEAYGEFHGKEMELFGAGMIRSEITGMERKSINVLAWGPGIERLILFKDQSVESISSMFNTGVGWIRKRGIR